jgi:hypothetical protein
MSYQGPILIKEPELRWPIVLLTALMIGGDHNAGCSDALHCFGKFNIDTSSSKRLDTTNRLCENALGP